uniref:PDZ domain-containing protein n=1 Tax=Peronospora matthiolae TaxID=2874970 RepID=A0AAV1U9R2_9STRA
MPKNNYDDDDDDDDLLMALQSMEPCGNCGADGAKIPCMSGCGEVFYCSRECNMHHASAHRLRCRNLRCSKFNDSESESGGSDDSEEYETDSGAEYETDSDEDEDEEEEEVEEAKSKKKKGKKKSRTKSRRVNSSRSVESSGSTVARTVSVDADVEKRIEEKILRRLKKQEEARIAQAIENRMREEKANWRDDEMNRIIMEMRERFQSEMTTSTFWTALAKKNGLEMESQEMQTLQKSMEHSFLASNPQSEDKVAVPLSAEEAVAAGVAAIDGSAEATVSRPRTVSKESSWNNACAAFDALRVVVWKHSFLPRLQFCADGTAGIWNTVTKLDADESLAHICVGDKLLSINGRSIDDAVQTEDDLNDVFAAYASPIIMKFEARDPSSRTCKIHDYTVTWSNGPLGVTLKDDCATQKIPIVNRLTKKSGSVAVKQNIAIGDVLVAINNIDTIQLGCSLSMSILKKVQLPAKLRFRGVGGPTQQPAVDTESPSAVPPRNIVTVSRAPSTTKHEDVSASIDDRAPSVMNLSISMSRPSKYSVNWGEGPLGLTIIPGLHDGDLPVIKKVTGTGNSVGIDKAQVGDFLESMNGIKAASMHFEDVVSFLKTAPKPVLLRFRSALVDDDTRDPYSHRSNGTALSARSDGSNSARTHSGYDNAPAHMSPRPQSSPVPAPAASYHATEITRQVSREPPSDLYKVVWGSGPLGLTIDAKPETGAFIKRIASQGAAAHLAQDCVGDDVTHINDMDVSHVAFSDIVAHLKNVPRPVSLFFRRKSSRHHHERHGSWSSNSGGNSPTRHAVPAPSHSRKAALAAAGEDHGMRSYSIVWQDGAPLGLSLRGAENGFEYPYISRVTGTGCAAHLPQSVLNDCLISVDGRSVHVRDRSFEEVMTLLKVMPKPLTLTFQTRNVGGTQSRAPAPSPVPTSIPAPAPQHQRRAPSPSPSPPPPQPQQTQQRKAIKSQESYTWRQNRTPPPPVPADQPLAQCITSSSVLGGNGTRGHNSNNLSRSFLANGGDRGLSAGATPGNEDKFSSIQAPFLMQNKLSTGRRQKMLKGLKK